MAAYAYSFCAAPPHYNFSKIYKQKELGRNFMALTMTKNIVGSNVYQIMPFVIRKLIGATYTFAMFCSLEFIGNESYFAIYLL